MELINLRSDTQTLPTPEMYAAMSSMPLGDDTYDEDPTVQKFEKRAADMLGKEAALLFPSGTMANLAALMVHGKKGDEVLLDLRSHLFHYEAGGLASIAGLMPRPLHSQKGRLDPEEVANSIRKPNIHNPTPRILCLENTHNLSGGRVVPLDLHRELCHIGKTHGLAVHLDGARIFNAAIAAGVPATDYAQDADSVMFCLTKGLSCPIGSVLVGTSAFVKSADHMRKLLGGGLRQAGIFAAAGLVALDQMVDRLAEDHALARYLAECVGQIPGLSVDLESVETNMVYVDVAPAGLDTPAALERLKAEGIIASSRPPTHFRICTNRHHDRKIIDEAIVRIRRAFAS